MWFKQILILATLEIFLVVQKLLFGIGLFAGKGFKNPARYSLYCFLTHVSCQNLPKPIFPRNVTGQELTRNLSADG